MNSALLHSELTVNPFSNLIVALNQDGYNIIYIGGCFYATVHEGEFTPYLQEHQNTYSHNIEGRDITNIAVRYKGQQMVDTSMTAITQTIEKLPVVERRFSKETSWIEYLKV